MNQLTTTATTGAKKPNYNSRTADKFVIRLTDGMRDRVRDASTASHRSMNSELLYRIENSFSQDQEVHRLNQVVDSLLQENKRLKQLHHEGLPA